MSAPVPFNESFRLEMLRAHCGDALPDDPALQRVTRLAQRLFDYPIATLTLLEEGRQILESPVGLDATETPRAPAFCNYTILSDDVFMVEDAAADPRFAANPLVTGPPHVRAYVGAPLITADGLRLGALCLIDHKPRRRPFDAELEALRDLAATAMETLELRRLRTAMADGAGQDLATLNAASDTAERAKEEFIAVVSHELRTPLNAVLGFSEMMRDGALGPLDPNYADMAASIHAGAQHLLGLVDNVLTFSNAQRAEILLNESYLAPAQVVDRARRVVAEKAWAGSVEIAVSLPADAPSLYADPHQLTQMLANLLLNGVRFANGSGRVDVGCGILADGSFCIFVSDSGQGMDAAELAEAMRPFRQVENGHARTHDGLGLGLPLTKRLIELHGGRLELETEKGIGTRAMLVFPAWRVSTAPA